jgi:hypothetical protein
VRGDDVREGPRGPRCGVGVREEVKVRHCSCAEGGQADARPGAPARRATPAA